MPISDSYCPIWTPTPPTQDVGSARMSRRISRTAYNPGDGRTFLFRTGSANYVSTSGAYATAPDCTPRFGGAPGMVRRNLLPWSHDFSMSNWTKLNCSILVNSMLAPGGTSSASKIVETTANGIHGVNSGAVTISGSPYTHSVYAKAGERSWLYITEGNNVTAQASFNLANGTLGTVGGTGSPSARINPVVGYPGWYRCELTFTPIGTVSSIQIRPSTGNNVASYVGDGASGVYAWGAQMEPGSLATPPQSTNATGIDWTNPINGAGLILEGSATNYLLNSDTPATQTVSLAAGTYTLFLDGTGSVDLSGGPTGTATATTPQTFTLASTTSVTFTVAGTVTRFDCQNLPFRSSHIPTTTVATTRNADMCAISGIYNELKYSHDLTNAAYVKSAGCTVTLASGLNTVTLAATTDNFYQQTDTTVTPIASTARTVVIKLRLGTLSGSVILRLLDQSGNTLPGSALPINTSSLSATVGRTFRITNTAGAAATAVRAQLIGNSGTGTIIVESMQLVQGFFPGVEVRTGDTPILRPANDGIDPAWNQNGFVEFDAVIPPPSTGLGYRVFGQGVDAAGVAYMPLTLWKYGGYLANRKQLDFTRRCNGSTVEPYVGSSTPPGSKDPFDGTKHRYRLEWTNYLIAGVRYMWQRLYIDDLLWVEQNVAALYGATLWTTLDRIFLSDGGPSNSGVSGATYATLSYPIIGYPPLPAGATLG